MRARQIPEWEEYDSEIAKFARKLVEEGKISSRVAAADSNALAQTAAGAGAVSPSDDIEVVDSEKNGVDEGETETEKTAERKKEIRDEL